MKIEMREVKVRDLFAGFVDAGEEGVRGYSGNLTPLVEVQRNTRALRQQVKAACENTSAFQRVDQDLARLSPKTLCIFTDR